MDWPLLRDVPEEDRRRVISAARLRRFARNEVIFHEGDPGDTLHLIAKGRVAVRTTTPQGEVATLTILAKGDVFGELALVGPPAPRSSTIVALEKTETLCVARDVFEELQDTYPSVARFLDSILAAQVRRLSNQVRDALYVGADQRVYRRLADLTVIYEEAERSVIPLTQEDLATMAGTSRATVNRVLGEAEDEGILAVRRMRIEIVDREKLSRRAL